MKNWLYKRGELRSRGTPHIEHDWSSAVLEAMANGDEFVDARIITLRDHYKDLAFTQAYDEMEITTAELPMDRWYDAARILMDSGTIEVRQYVEISENGGIMICIHADEIDQFTVERALDMLAKSGMEEGRHEFGPKRTFKSFEIK